MKIRIKRIFGIGKSVAALIFSVCILMTSSQVGMAYAANADNVLSSLHHNEYKLEQVVVLSRYNIRSPLSGKGSTLDKSTPYKWHEWTSAPSELSLKGGMLETSTEQLRNVTMLDLTTPPCIYHLQFNEIKQNQDGLYLSKDLENLFLRKINDYDILYSIYAKQAA